MSGYSRLVKDALVAMLQAVTYDAGGGAEPAFVSVLDNTKDEFSGYPAALVLPDKVTSASESFGTMQHTSSFVVVVHLPVASTTNVQQAQYNKIYDLTDAVMNAIESGFYSNYVSQHAAGVNAYIVTCKQAQIRTADSKVGPILLASLNVDITYSQAIN